MDSKDELKIDFKARIVQGTLSTITFKQGDFLVRYLPSVKLSAYGENIEELEEMTQLVLDDLFGNLFEVKLSEAMDELRRLGWLRHKFFRRKLVQLSETTIDDLMRDFDIPANTEISKDKLAIGA